MKRANFYREIYLVLTLFCNFVLKTSINMSRIFTTFGNGDDEQRRDELIRKIEHSVERLKLQELEALYYDMLTKDYMKD